jgi:hypothetical protein
MLCADNEFDIFDSIEADNFIANNTFNARSTTTSPSECVFLLDQFGVVELLKERLYRHTNPLNTRSLLDYPLFIIEGDRCFANTLTFSAFYNETTQMKFVQDCKTINSYLAVSPDQGFVEKLQAILNLMREADILTFDPDVVIDIFSLLENFNVQERRAGIMFNYFKESQERNIILNVLTPFYYVERNHFVNEQIQAAITAITDPLFGAQSEEEKQRFIKMFMIDDKLGWGNTRLEVYFPPTTVLCFFIRPGLMFTLPTAYAFETGIYGTEFVQTGIPPRLDLCKFINEQAATETPSAQSVQQAAQFGLCAVRRLSAILLDAPLGNNGHLGIGPVMRTEGTLSFIIPRPWADKIQIKGRTSLEYLCPNTEIRSFVTQDPLAGFQGRDFSDASKAPENLAFLLQTLTDRLFPYALPTLVQPGIIYRSSTRFVHEGDHWGFFLGNDFWLQTGEILLEIKGPNYLVNQLDVYNATRQLAYESKAFGGITYRRDKGDYAYSLSLCADMTYVSSGIGDDFSVLFAVNIHF